MVRVALTICFFLDCRKNILEICLAGDHKGQAAISPARAEAFGPKIDGKTLPSSKIARKYGWE